MTDPTKYRARPRDVEAIRYDGSEECRAAILAFMGGPEHARVKVTMLPSPGRGLTNGIRVETFTESIAVRVGYWLVRHDLSKHSYGGLVSKRHEAIDGDMFHTTFEPVTSDTDGHTCAPHGRTTEADCPACRDAERALARGETHL